MNINDLNNLNVNNNPHDRTEIVQKESGQSGRLSGRRFSLIKIFNSLYQYFKRIFSWKASPDQVSPGQALNDREIVIIEAKEKCEQAKRALNAYITVATKGSIASIKNQALYLKLFLIEILKPDESKQEEIQQFPLDIRSTAALQRADLSDRDEFGALAPDEEQSERDGSVMKPESGRQWELLQSMTKHSNSP